MDRLAEWLGARGDWSFWAERASVRDGDEWDGFSEAGALCAFWERYDARIVLGVRGR